ncbi:MAG: aminotransferase class I/II-fold pyridoxal phosphate-dependent enzyme [Selenomonadaceae bacterium]|nr:aminotransferase class I/II-fold pyridoxal phosphate-dependent enzyme [Selenomonadaceae bacterium]
MSTTMTATHAAGRKLKDTIFDANQACNEAIKIHGADAVTNATIGVVLDEEGKLATLPTVEKVFRSMDFSELVAYAPISGLPAYLDAVIDLTFADNKPEGYFGAVATAGGTGAIHHAIANYAERGDAVLTSDWRWGTYDIICNETGKRLETFKLFDTALNFNLSDFAVKVDALLKKQKSLLVIINSPAHNPTGYALSSDEWDKVLDVLKAQVSTGKKISLLVDIAYIDFAGEKNSTRAFMKKFSDLPKNLFVMISFSMSKSYTFYGQRTGALIGVSSSAEIIDDFKNVSKYSCRATWSNINRGAQVLLVKLAADKELLPIYEAERTELYNMVKRRADVFVAEAKACGLRVVPYKGGFFIAVPAENPAEVCKKLHDELIFAVPLKLGIRVAACSTSFEKMHGVAEKILRAMK